MSDTGLLAISLFVALILGAVSLIVNWHVDRYIGLHRSVKGFGPLPWRNLTKEYPLGLRRLSKNTEEGMKLIFVRQTDPLLERERVRLLRSLLFVVVVWLLAGVLVFVGLPPLMGRSG